MSSFTETFVVVHDYNENTGKSLMIVALIDSGGTKNIINAFTDETANQIYERLIKQKGELL